MLCVLGRSQINGVNLNQNGHLPPPPPGFVQPNSHMNSFGELFCNEKSKFNKF